MERKGGGARGEGWFSFVFLGGGEEGKMRGGDEVLILSR